MHTIRVPHAIVHLFSHDRLRRVSRQIITINSSVRDFLFPNIWISEFESKKLVTTDSRPSIPLFNDATFTERRSFKNSFYSDRPFTRNVHWSNSHPSYISDRLEREKLGFFVRRANANHFTLRTAICYYELHESMKLVAVDGKRVFGMYANKVDRMRARPPALFEKSENASKSEHR